jgi:hypothetical protein
VGLAIGLWYVALGYDETHRRLGWLKPSLLVGAGVVLALVNGVAAAMLGLSTFAYVEYDTLVGIPMPPGLHLSSGLVTEAAIFLAVLGGVTYVLDGLGHPGDQDIAGDELPESPLTEGSAEGLTGAAPVTPPGDRGA